MLKYKQKIKVVIATTLTLTEIQKLLTYFGKEIVLFFRFIFN